MQIKDGSHKISNMPKSIADEIIAISSGARFIRADLHIHSHGASHDVSDVSMTPEAIVKQALTENLSVIAITDHNEISNVPRLMSAASGKPLLAIPGVELTTPQGHLLVYFSTAEDLATFFGKLSFAERGTQTSRCQTGILECLNLVDPSKGFAILAHVDGDGGIERVINGNPPYKSDVICHQALVGIESHSALSTISYSDSDPDQQRAECGRKRIATLGLGSKQNLARVLFSDSHSLNALGKNAQGNRKLTRLKMDIPSFNGVRIALQDADARVRLEDEIPASVPYLLGMKLQGGFLDGQVIHFARNLNCIIGGRGAGKSTAFEAARIGATTPSTNALIDSEVWPETIHLVWVDQAGQQHTLRKRMGESPENIDDPAFGITSFPIQSYGQSETAQTSAQAQYDPTSLLRYLDEFSDVADLIVDEERCRADLLANQSDIEKAQTQVSQAPEYKKRLTNVQTQLEALKAANATEVVALERKVAEERALRGSIQEQMTSLGVETSSTAIIDILDEIQGMAKAENLKVGATEFTAIHKLVEAFSTAAKKSQTELAAGAKSLSVAVRKQIEEWKNHERQVTDQIEAKRKELFAKNIKLDGAYIKKLATDEAEFTES